MEDLNWDLIGSHQLLSAGHKVNEPSLLFEKIEDDVIDVQINKLLATKAANEAESKEAAPIRKNISFEDFQTMDIRIGTVLEAEKVAKTKKLMKLKVDTGIDQRTVVSGIAEHYLPEEMIGKQVSILVNLEPRKIRGIESQGMILMAEDASGKLVLVSPMSEVKPGSEVK